MCKNTVFFILFTSAALLHGETAQANTIELACPEVQAIQITKQPYPEDWRAYKYDSSTFVDLPALQNTLVFSGQGANETITQFNNATWTDETFLCWYKGNKDSLVLFTPNLDPYVTSCYFGQKPGPVTYACTATSPQDCLLRCEIKMQKSLSGGII